MLFGWDEHNIEHIARHGVTLEEAQAVMLGDPLHISTEFRGGEERNTYLGPADEERMLIAVVTARGKRIRVVTAFPADRRSRAYYFTVRSQPQ